jgi:hypothetical protein
MIASVLVEGVAEGVEGMLVQEVKNEIAPTISPITRIRIQWKKNF